MPSKHLWHTFYFGLLVGAAIGAFLLPFINPKISTLGNINFGKSMGFLANFFGLSQYGWLHPTTLILIAAALCFVVFAYAFLKIVANAGEYGIFAFASGLLGSLILLLTLGSLFGLIASIIFILIGIAICYRFEKEAPERPFSDI